MRRSAADRRIRKLRPPKPRVDPWTPHGTLLEQERRPGGRLERVFTVFLAGSECPFTCSFCDLWRWTLEGPTPVGALPRQLEHALQSVTEPPPDRLKFYNASNFFDPRAVPPEDWPGIAECAARFSAITVESHARTIGPRTRDFAGRIAGRLEVAIGLETIHPAAMGRLNKRLDLARFDQASGFLAEHDIDLRVFVLLGAPDVPADESVEWTVRTATYAARRGAAAVALIPVRGGNGELERLQSLGRFTPPTLSQLESALERCLNLSPAVVTADLWDAERLPACLECRSARIERLQRLNLTGQLEPPSCCSGCDR